MAKEINNEGISEEKRVKADNYWDELIELGETTAEKTSAVRSLKIISLERKGGKI